MNLNNWLIQSVTYDGAQRILELEMNTRERFQHVGIPRRIAIALVQAGTYRFRRVRVQRESGHNLKVEAAVADPTSHGY